MKDSVGQCQDKMEKKQYDIILEKIGNLKNLPNNKLLEYLDTLSSDFEMKKAQIISLTIDLDNIELLYNNVLKEYQNRNKQ